MSNRTPKVIRQQVWYYWIGAEIGKTKCFCCNFNDITQLEFHCGHIEAHSKGGNMTLDNLRPVCGKCNLSMGNVNMIDFMLKCDYDTSCLFKSLTDKEDSFYDSDKNNHKWSEEDEIYAFLCYKFSNNSLYSLQCPQGQVIFLI